MADVAHEWSEGFEIQSKQPKLRPELRGNDRSSVGTIEIRMDRMNGSSLRRVVQERVRTIMNSGSEVIEPWNRVRNQSKFELDLVANPETNRSVVRSFGCSIGMSGCSDSDRLARKSIRNEWLEPSKALARSADVGMEGCDEDEDGDMIVGKWRLVRNISEMSREVFGKLGLSDRKAKPFRIEIRKVPESPGIPISCGCKPEGHKTQFQLNGNVGMTEVVNQVGVNNDIQTYKVQLMDGQGKGDKGKKVRIELENKLSLSRDFSFQPESRSMSNRLRNTIEAAEAPTGAPWERSKFRGNDRNPNGPDERILTTPSGSGKGSDDYEQ
ncbi:hypothetical protein DFJ43DRAFT_1140037 [Lentinula guzmanii]|uniref:Uncharacterized protein n=1 Tax=Lentinula guzmanii TaxID=2804957 RepID=A0AA38JN00_9AGAR|nr:hypothetical protein DFJ43DRAFT_1140037 [Lentinula guzmanii]